MYYNYFVYDFIKAKPSAEYGTAVTDAIVSIFKEGNLLEGIKYEAFINKLQIPGGDISGVPDLPYSLSDTVSFNPIFSDVRRWRQWRYGCTAQYQGKGDFLHGREWVLGIL